jgi:hypothetical protein
LHLLLGLDHQLLTPLAATEPEGQTTSPALLAQQILAMAAEEARADLAPPLALQVDLVL